MLAEKTKETSVTVSTRKLPGLTDQPQKTPATILQEKKYLSSNEVGDAQNIMNIAKERDKDLKQKVLTMCFQYIHCPIVTFLLMPTSRNCCQLSFNPCIWRYGTSCSSNNTDISVPLEIMTVTMQCFTRTTHSTCNTSVCLLSPHQTFIDICTSISFCWKHLSTDATHLAMMTSIDVISIAHHISN